MATGREGNRRGPVKRVMENAANVSGSIADGVKELAGKRRGYVVMVRVDAEASEKLDLLVKSRLAPSRSLAAAYLIKKGVEACASKFAAIDEKTQAIREAELELQQLWAEEESQS